MWSTEEICTVSQKGLHVGSSKTFSYAVESERAADTGIKYILSYLWSCDPRFASPDSSGKNRPSLVVTCKDLRDTAVRHPESSCLVCYLVTNPILISWLVCVFVLDLSCRPISQGMCMIYHVSYILYIRIKSQNLSCRLISQGRIPSWASSTILTLWRKN